MCFWGSAHNVHNVESSGQLLRFRPGGLNILNTSPATIVFHSHWDMLGHINPVHEVTSIVGEKAILTWETCMMLLMLNPLAPWARSRGIQHDQHYQHFLCQNRFLLLTRELLIMLIMSYQMESD